MPFVSTRVKKQPAGSATHLVSGDLTLHGVKKSLSFPATLKVQDGSLSGTAEFSINGQDFGIVYSDMPDDLIKDLVVIKLDIQASPR